MSPVEIESFTPEARVPSDISATVVSVTFSREMDRVSAEGAFSLAAAGTAVPGAFSWVGRTLTFTPLAPLRENRTYEMGVVQQAQDLYGNSLREPFVHEFAASDDEIRPQVAANTPDDGAEVETILPSITVQFTEPMDSTSVYNALSLSPEVSTRYTWNEENSTVTIDPTENLAWQTTYRVTVGATAADRAGNTLGTPHEFEFTVGTDGEPPQLVFVGTGDESIELSVDDPDDSSLTVGSGVSARDDLLIRFDEPVDRAAAVSGISVDPQWEYTIAPSVEATITEVLLVGEDPLVYDQSYTLSIEGSVDDAQGNRLGTTQRYRFLVNASDSRFPSIARVGFRTAGTTDPLAIMTQYGLYEFDDGTPDYGIIDLYFVLADGASVPPLELMDAFSISATNNAVDAYAVQVVDSLPSSPDPDAPVPPQTGETVVRLIYYAADDLAVGTVTFQLADSFSDSLGNQATDTWQFTVNNS